ncbi:PP2C family protein-serine/threonine phosphatase [Streptomyces sp. NPDC002574]|uniref:PP2C family protein-serine/threonine phosphatase n=1 Tax=Streptomyces sp. NPDC002574 TaxID=3364652 RepID=UPI00368657CB
MIGPRVAMAMTGRVRGWLLLAWPGAWVVAVLGLACGVPGGDEWLPGVAAAPALACAGSGRRRCVAVHGGLAVAALFVPGPGRPRPGAAVAVVVVLAACFWLADRRSRLAAELSRAREVAVAAQRVLLRPLPHRVSGLTVAADHVSASRGADVGGDLYEVLATPYGVRAVIGDVRGHGLEAIGTVAALLGTFREAAHDEQELGGLLVRMDRALARHVRERPLAAEEFVTLMLLQLDEDGQVDVLNCGHPGPYRLSADRPGRVVALPLEAGEPLPPLGLVDAAAGAKAVRCGQLLPGEALFLHTDGVPDARDADGAFFPLTAALEGAARAAGGHTLCARALVDAVRAAFMRHTRGRLTDDMALLVLHRDAPRVPVQACGARTVTRRSGVPRV